MAGFPKGDEFKRIVDQVENGTDHDTTPVQVRAAHTGATIDLSAFSRRRPVNTDSSVPRRAMVVMVMVTGTGS